MFLERRNGRFITPGVPHDNGAVRGATHHQVRPSRVLSQATDALPRLVEVERAFGSRLGSAHIPPLDLAKEIATRYSC